MTRSPRRGAWLAGTGAVLAATSIAGRRGAFSQTPSPLQVLGGSAEGSAEAFYAEARGFFKAHGLNPVVHNLPNGGQIPTAVASGDYQIGCGNVLSLGQAHAHGFPFVIIASGGIINATSPSSQLAVAYNSPIRSPKDLNGKSLAVPSLNGLLQLQATVLIDRSGGDPASVKFVELGVLTMVDAITSGRVDAAVLIQPQLSPAMDAKLVRSIGNGDAAIGLNAVNTAWFVLRSWLDAPNNKDTARRFADAIYATGGWANANPEKAVVILRKYVKTTQQRAYARFATKDDLPEIQAVMDLGAKYNFLPPTNAADMVWNGKLS